MNILILRPIVEVGGVKTVITNLCLGFLQQNHTVTVATTWEETPRYFEQKNIPVIPLTLYPSTPKNVLTSAVKIIEIVKKRKIDVIHSTHRFTTIIGKFVERFTDASLVTAIHEFKEDRRVLARLWTSDFTIVPSEALKKHLISYYSLNANNLYVIPNAVQPIHITDKNYCASLREEMFDPGKSVMLGYIGRLSPEKGVQYFIDSIDILRKKNYAVAAIIAGSGPEEEFLRNYTHRLGLDGSITFLGTRTDVAELLELIDIVVMPSILESFGAVALEAMLAARPVIATSVGGLPEVIRKDISGYLVPPRSPTHISEAIIDLILDPEKRKQLGNNGREIAINEYSIEKMVANYLEIFKNSIDKKIK